eukprot:gene684-1307_t
MIPASGAGGRGFDSRSPPPKWRIKGCLLRKGTFLCHKRRKEIFILNPSKRKGHKLLMLTEFFDPLPNPEVNELESNQEVISTFHFPTQNEKLNSLHKSKARYQLRDFYRKQLCTPEWMSEVPEDLSHEWFVIGRPEGSRCMVAASRGRTLSRHMDGRVIQSFLSQLPGGGLDGHMTESATLLDCIYCDNSYSTGFNQSSRKSRISFAANIALLNADKSYIPDGLLFYHKKAHYALGLSPLVLFWKDERTSRYAIGVGGEGGMAMDGQAATATIALQLVILDQNSMSVTVANDELDGNLLDLQTANNNMDGSGSETMTEIWEDGKAQLVTMDGVSLFQMSLADMVRLALSEGDIVRCSCTSENMGGGEVDDDDGNSNSNINMSESDLLKSLEVVPLKKCSGRKALPDPWSKICFTFRLSICPITFDMLG